MTSNAAASPALRRSPGSGRGVVSFPEPRPADIREALGRVLASPQFDASERNRSFLAYVVGEALAGRADRIKAYTIATTVFRRDASFDPQIDAIVRIEAGRLRRSLERYYLTCGRDEAIRIGIPKGTYAPVFAIDGGPDPEAAGPAAAARADIGPRIVVAAFEDEGDPSVFPRFARGFARALVVGLTRFTDLFVLGPEAGVQPGPEADLARLRDTLQVDYLLTGATTLSARYLRVEALLVDVESGRTVWAESFERSLATGEIDRLRTEIAAQVVSTLAQPYGVIFSVRARDRDGAPPGDVCSYDCGVRFHQYALAPDPAQHAALRQALERAVLRDPHDAEAHACLARVYLDADRLELRGAAKVQDPLAQALALAERAVALAPRASSAHCALGLSLWYRGDIEAALEALERAHLLNPNDTTIMAELGHRLALRMRWERAMPLIEAAFARNPCQPSLYRTGAALFHLANGRTAEARAEARRIGRNWLLDGIRVPPRSPEPPACPEAAAERTAPAGTAGPEDCARLADRFARERLHPDLIRVLLGT